MDEIYRLVRRGLLGLSMQTFVRTAEHLLERG